MSTFIGILSGRHDLETVVDTLKAMAHRPETEQTMRALVARFGGWVRETGQYDPEPVRADPDVSNPAYDLRVDLQECLPEAEYQLVRALARLSREDPEALSNLRGVIDTYLRRLPAPEAEQADFSPR